MLLASQMTGRGEMRESVFNLASVGSDVYYVVRSVFLVSAVFTVFLLVREIGRALVRCGILWTNGCSGRCFGTNHSRNAGIKWHGHIQIDLQSRKMRSGSTNGTYICVKIMCQTRFELISFFYSRPREFCRNAFEIFYYLLHKIF